MIFWKKLKEVKKYYLIIFLTVLGINVLSFTSYPISIIASLAWVFLPGFLLYSGLFEEEKLGILSCLKIFALSLSFTLVLFPLFALPFMFIFRMPMRFLSILFLDTTFCIHFYLKLKKKPIRAHTINQNSGHIFVFLLLILIFALSIFTNYSQVFSRQPLFVFRDQMIYLQSINAFRSGTYPPPNLFYSGTINTNYMANLPSFINYSATFEIADLRSVEGNLCFLFLQNAIVTIVFLSLAYLIIFELTNSKFAGIITVIFFGFGTDILGAISYLHDGLLPAYQGVLTPYMFQGNTFFSCVPSLGFNLLFKGFEIGPALIVSLFFIYMLGRYATTRERGMLFLLILLFAPVYLLFHMGVMSPFYIAIGIYAIMTLIRKYFKCLDDRVGLFVKNTKAKLGSSNIFFLVFLPIIILFLILYFNANLGTPLSDVLRFRILPVDTTVRALLLYFGPSLFLSMIGLAYLLKIRKLSSVPQFIVVWFLTAMVFLVFTDLYTGESAIANYFLYFNATIPAAILAGVGLSQLMNMHLPKQKLASFSNFLLIVLIVSSVILSSVSWYTTNYAEVGEELGPRYDLRVSENDILAYNFIISHTPKDAVFLTSPQNWLIPPLTGRAIVMEEGYAVLNERDLDIVRMFTSRDLRKTVELLKKYSVNFIYLSSQECDEYGEKAYKFFNFPEVFPVVYSKNGVTIFSVNYDTGKILIK